MVSASGAYDFIMAMLPTVMWGLLIVGILGVAFWFWANKGIKRIPCKIYAKRTDGKAHLIGRTTLIRLPRDRQGRVFWKFKKPNIKVPAPPDICIEKAGRKEQVAYLKYGEDYVPLVPEVHLGTIKKVSVKDPNNPRKKIIKETLEPSITFKPMNYDVNLFRIEESRIRLAKYKNKDNWWDKNKGMIMWGGLIIAFIVLVYFGFEYVTNILDMGAKRLDRSTGVLEKILERVGTGGAAKPPPGY